jgi:AcrR family transcriptional regulator
LPHLSTASTDRDAVLTAAETMVGTGSFTRLTPAAVARTAGVSLEQLRRVFRTRSDLVQAVCEARHQAWFRDLLAGLTPDADPRDQILEVFLYIEHDVAGCCPCLTSVGTGQNVATALASGHLVEVEHLMASLCEEAGFPVFMSDALVLLIEGAAMTVRAKESSAPVRTARTAAAMLMSVYEPSDTF